MTYFSRLSALLSGIFLLGIAFSPVSTQAQDAPFVTVWDTENSGVTNDDKIKIPGTGTAYQIIWEEVGNTSNRDTVTATDVVTIAFPNPGLYRVKISGDFTRIHFGGDDGGDVDKVVEVTQWGSIQWSTMEEAFTALDFEGGPSNLEMSAGDTPNLSNVTSMAEMFTGASPSFTASGSSIGQWDVANVTNMRDMFRGGTSFNADINGWNVSDVTNMSSMFEGADDFNQDIGGWNVSGVTSMDRMFSNADDFNQEISGWDVSSVISMRRMFEGADDFNQSIGNWDVSSVTDMVLMFSRANSFNQDISSWDISNVADMTGIFGLSALSPANYDRVLTGWALQNPKGGVRLDAAGIEYCNSAPFRTHLIGEFDWSLNDSGKQSGCPNILAASNAKQVDSDGKFEFGDMAMSMNFFGTVGSGRVTAARYSDAPRNVEGISESNVSEYRLVIAEGGITFFDSTKVHLAVSEYGGISQPEDVTVHKRPQPGNGSFGSLTTTVDDNGTPDDISDDTLSAKVTEGFGEFVLASNNNELPVELAGFNGTATEGSARLTWQTASETNNAGFEVQREKEDSWAQVGFVESKASGGTTTETQSYSYTAENLPVGTHRFRLKQVDLDGSSTLIDPVSVDIQMQEAVKLTAPAPNPVSSTATLSFAIKEQTETTVSLYNTLGQRVATVYDGTPQAGEQQRVQFDASSLSSGSYFLRLQAGGRTATKRITVVQ